MASTIRSGLCDTHFIRLFGAFTCPPSQRTHYPPGYVDTGVQVPIIGKTAIRTLIVSIISHIGYGATAMALLRSILGGYIFHGYTPFEGFLLDVGLELTEG